MRSLEAAPRCLLIRLLLLKDPWHNSAIMKYVQDVPGAVAALERAGALLSYQATATRDQTEELLPCLTVGHELKAVRREVMSAATALAKAAGGKLRKLRPEEEGEKKDALVARIKGLAGTYAAAPASAPAPAPAPASAPAWAQTLA